MVAVAIWDVSETRDHRQGAQNSPLLRLPPPDTQRHPQITIVERQRPGWTGEVRAPNQDEALSSLVPGNGGGLRIGLVIGLLIVALGLGWAGILDPYRFLKPDPTLTEVQQTPLSDRVAPAIGQETSGAPISSQASTPTGSDLSTYKVGGEPIHRADRRVVSPEDTVPSNAQKTTATEQPTAVPLLRENKSRSRLTPTPETRPNTIVGWRVKQVSGGKVVLQGPDGIHKASIGDTVPGAGRIDSIVRWGNRLLVATSRGLITTD